MVIWSNKVHFNVPFQVEKNLFLENLTNILNPWTKNNWDSNHKMLLALTRHLTIKQKEKCETSCPSQFKWWLINEIMSAQNNISWTTPKSSTRNKYYIQLKENWRSSNTTLYILPKLKAEFLNMERCATFFTFH